MEHEEVLFEADKEFQRMFLEMKNMVKELWEYLERIRATPHQNEGGPVEAMVKDEGEGEKPPGSPSSPSSSPSSSSDESEHSSRKRKKHSKKSSCSHDLNLLNLDVKFDFPNYDGELNVEKLDNWVK
jgi:hypothetical protein